TLLHDRGPDQGVEHVLVAEVDVEIFDLGGERRAEHRLEAGARCPAVLAARAAADPPRHGHAALLAVQPAIGDAGRHVRQEAAKRPSGPAAGGAEPTDLGRAGAGAAGAITRGRAPDPGLCHVVFEAEHPRAELPVAPPGQAGEAAVDPKAAAVEAERIGLAR